jgi:hypothetical protein
MRAVGFIAWSGAARRAAAGLALAALMALAGGVVLAASAGARRTDSAYDRLSTATRWADVVVAAQGDPSLFDPSIAVDGPGVASSGIVDGFAVAELHADGTIDLGRSIAALVAPTDMVAFNQIDRPPVIEGRLPKPDGADEVVITDITRDAGHPLGSAIEVCLFNFAEATTFGDDVLSGTLTPERQRAFVEDICAVRRLQVVGVVGPGPDDVVLNENSERQVFITGSPALAADPGRAKTFSFVLVDLEHGADVNTFVDSVLDRASPDAGVTVQAAALRSTVVARTIEPYVRALALFAAIAAVAAIGVLGPAVARWAATVETDRAPLLAMGLQARQLRMASLLRGAALGVVAAIGAVAIAIGASGWFPIGVAADIEPSPGLRVDVPVLVLGASAVVLLSAALGATATTRTRPTIRRGSRIADALQTQGVTPAISAGVRAALSRGGRPSVPTAAGVAIAIAAVVTALTYQAGLGRLLDNPSRYGWTWDVFIDGGGESIPSTTLTALTDEPLVTALSTGRQSSLLRDGTAVPITAIAPQRGNRYPTIVEGRPPHGDAEIALGGQTLDRLHAHVGERMRFRGPNGVAFDASIVGRVLLPISNVSQDLSISEGALSDDSLLDRIGGADVSLALVDLVPGATADDLRAALRARGVPDAFSIQGPTYSADLRGYDEVRQTPLLLAGLLALLGIGVLAYTISATTHRRRSELAVLRSLGFLRRDVRATVRWHALTIVAVCVIVAVPIGIGIGRTLWSAFARGIGVVDDPLTPALSIAAVVVAAIVGALVLAVGPGRKAGRLRPADVLRSE